MFVLNIFFAHTFSTILLSFYYIDKVNNWIIYFGYASRPWYEIYIWAFYWAASIIPNTGQGDIYPVTLQQALIVGLIKVLTLSLVVLIDIIRMDAILRLRESGKKLTGIFRSHAERDKIKSQLKERIERYLNRVQKDDTKSTYQERIAFLKDLPTSLQHKYLIEFSHNRLRRLPVFQLLHNSTIINMALKIYQTYYTPKDMILKCSTKRPNRISILINGAVNFLCKNNLSELSGKIVHQFQVEEQKLNQKDPILLDFLFIDQSTQLNYNVIAVKTSKVLHLNTTQFFDTIRQSQIDKEYFFQLCHRHSFFANQWCNIECTKCPGQFHTLFLCPRLHYVPLLGIIYLKETKPASFQLKNQRNIIFHRKRTKFRQKERQTNFLLLKQFKQLEKCMGVSQKKKQQKKYFNQKIKYTQVKGLKYTERANSNSIQKNGFCRIQPFKNEEQEFFGKPDFPLKPQKIFSLKQNYVFELLLDRNMPLNQIPSSKRRLQQLKNRLHDIIIQRLKPELHGFWDLEIDKMQNYKLYFPSSNPSQLHFKSLGHIAFKF